MDAEPFDTPRPPRKGGLASDNNAMRIDLAMESIFRFLHSAEGSAIMLDVEFAKGIGTMYARERFKDVLVMTSSKRKGKAEIQKSVESLSEKAWAFEFPSGMKTVFLRFMPKPECFGWKALPLIELPKGISLDPKHSSELFLAIDFLDIYDSAEGSRDSIGRIDQWTLFTAHAFYRLAQRTSQANASNLREALDSFVNLSLWSESKALIENDKGEAIYALKTKEGCIYFMGETKAYRGQLFRFFLSSLDESELYDYNKRRFANLHATSDTWTDEPARWRGWSKIPIASEPATSLVDAPPFQHSPSLAAPKRNQLSPALKAPIATTLAAAITKAHS